MLKEHKFSIDGHDYQLTQLGAIQGRRIWLKLLHVLAAPLKELAQQETFNQSAGVMALAALVQSLDDATTEELYAVFGQTCRVRNGEKWPLLDETQFDLHFAGRYISMSKWLGECLRFNFAGFLGDTSLGSIVALASKATGSKSTSPTISTGTSGDSSPTNEHPSSTQS